MNREHLLACLWLRWRLRINQMKRGGVANAVILGLLAMLTLVVAIVLFGVGLLLGLYVLGDKSPAILLYVWDGLLLAFLFCWSVGLLADLQRTEALSLDKFLHLPVSLTGAFLINYVSSWFSVTLILFTSAMLGLSIGLVGSRGAAMLLLFPLIATLLLAVTALTYQFQGWLGSLMTNPRRRRTVIVTATGVFILVCQLPQLINFIRPWDNRGRPNSLYDEERGALEVARADGKITREEYAQQRQVLDSKHQAEREAAGRAKLSQLEATARWGNVIFPPGWLALGAAGAGDGDLVPGLLATLGFSLIGGASLWRAYGTTVRLYTGQYTKGTAQRVAALEVPRRPAVATAGLLNKQLPWLSEQTSAVALGSFVSLLRAPEAKMMFLTPIIFGILFGSLLFSQSGNLSGWARALLPLGGMAMILTSMIQLAGNQFGFDRTGFRVFVLSPVPRRDVLLGKNLAFAPLPLVWGVIFLAVIESLFPLRWDHLLAAVPLMVAMYLLFLMMMNWLSILAPIPIASGSFKPANPKMVPLLLHLLFFVMFPVGMAPVGVPLAVEWGAEQLGWSPGVPLYLMLAVVVFVVVGLVYRVMLHWQGEALQALEQKILSVVTTKD